VRSILHGSLLLACSLVVATSAVAMAASPQVFELPDHGTLTLLMPDGWAGEMAPPRSQSPPLITVGPRSGPKFVVFITPMRPAAAGKMPDENAIRSEVAGAAKSAASQAVQSALPLQEIKGVDGRGFYFTATDRAPRPGEAKYLAQGIIRAGEIALAFTVLTNDGQEAVVSSAVDMLRTAVYRPR